MNFHHKVNIFNKIYKMILDKMILERHQIYHVSQQPYKKDTYPLSKIIDILKILVNT